MNKLKVKLKLKKLHEAIHNLKLKVKVLEEPITFEDFTDLSNRVDTLLDIFIKDTKPEDNSCISGTLVGQRRNNEWTNKVSGW